MNVSRTHLLWCLHAHWQDKLCDDQNDSIRKLKLSLAERDRQFRIATGVQNGRCKMDYAKHVTRILEIMLNPCQYYCKDTGFILQLSLDFAKKNK